MLWSTILKNEINILNFLNEKKYYEEMLAALMEDVGVDSYQDTQPGGGNCLSQNYKKQEKCNQKLNLLTAKSLFPMANKKDLLLVEELLSKLENLNCGPNCHYYCLELMDEVLQAFLFFRHFNSYMLTKETIDDFCSIGTYIVKNFVARDDETETFILKETITFSAFYEMKNLKKEI